MLVRSMHISHFDVSINKHVVPHPRIVQLTGSKGNCKKLAAYLGLSMNQMRMSSFPHEPIKESFRLVDIEGVERGQIHFYELGWLVHEGQMEFASGVQLVLDKAWMKEQER